MPNSLSDSRFYMWRAVVAMIHADGVVTPQELSFVYDYMNDIDLSPEQREVIGKDIHEPQLIHQMFGRITEAQDRKDFFALARALCWCDGDLDEQENKILLHLEKSHDMNESQALLMQTRNVIDEVELCGDQWHCKTEKSNKLFGFLNNMRKATKSLIE